MVTHELLVPDGEHASSGLEELERHDGRAQVHVERHTETAGWLTRKPERQRFPGFFLGRAERLDCHGALHSAQPGCWLSLLLGEKERAGNDHCPLGDCIAVRRPLTWV